MTQITHARGEALWDAILQESFRRLGGPVGTRKLMNPENRSVDGVVLDKTVSRVEFLTGMLRQLEDAASVAGWAAPVVEGATVLLGAPGARAAVRMRPAAADLVIGDRDDSAVAVARIHIYEQVPGALLDCVARLNWGARWDALVRAELVGTRLPAAVPHVSKGPEPDVWDAMRVQPFALPNPEGETRGWAEVDSAVTGSQLAGANQLGLSTLLRMLEHSGKWI